MFGMKYLWMALLVLTYVGQAKPSGSIEIYQTSRAGDRLKRVEPVREPCSDVQFIVNPAKTFQTVVGIGSSFTESSAAVWSELSEKKREELLKLYFSKEGAWISLTRTPIASCDFSLRNYTYAAVPNDIRLEHFSIEPDRAYLLPFIKAAQAVESASFNLLASPWTAPPWMKTNDDWNGGELKKSCYPVFAHYISKYIDAYAAEEIPIWGVTPVNEPLGNDSNWESVHFNAEQMRDYIADYLGPRLQEDHPHVSMWMYDQNREEEMMEWAHTIYGDSTAASYVRGTAVHWYQSTIDVGGACLDELQDHYPTKEILHSEGCIDSIGNDEPIGDWLEDDWYWRAAATDWGYFWAQETDKKNHPKYRPFYRYTRDLIEGFNHHLVGWIDWNMLLNYRGGPNHARNFCLAPILVDSGRDTYYVTPLYYSIAHMSKFVRPGAKRIDLSGTHSNIACVAFLNTDASVVLILFNTHTERVRFSVAVDDVSFAAAVPGEALQTIVIHR